MTQHERLVSIGLLILVALIMGGLIGFAMTRSVPQKSCHQVVIHIPPNPDYTITVCP